MFHDLRTRWATCRARHSVMVLVGMALYGHCRTALNGLFRRGEMIAIDCADQTPTAGWHQCERNNQRDCPTNHKKILSSRTRCCKLASCDGLSIGAASTTLGSVTVRSYGRAHC